MEKWAFDILGIEQTTDKKAIKKAYAELVKKYHSEEYPEEWEQIHNAYQTAMQYAQGTSVWKKSPETSVVYNRENNLSEKEQGSGVCISEEETDPVGENYKKIFQGIQKETEEREKERIEKVCKELEKLSALQRSRAYSSWKKFLSSDIFKEASEEMLEMMLESLQMHKPNKWVQRLIKSEMEGRIQDYQASMQLQKARLAEEIVRCCSTDPHKKEVYMRKYMDAIVIIIIIILFVIFVPIWSHYSSEKGSSMDDAKKIAVKYINKKYQTQYKEEDFLEEPYYSKELFDGKRKRLGNKVWTLGENPITVYIIASEGENAKTNVVCFDDRQTEEIAEALKKEAEELTGYTNSSLFLDTSFEEGLEDSEKNAFHACYKGDLQKFFEEETEARAEIVSGIDNTVATIRFAFYAPDLQCDTIEKRLQNSEDIGDLSLKEGLEKLEDTYHIEGVGALLLEKYYQELMQAEDKKEKGKGYWLASSWNIQDSYMERIEPALPFAFMTKCYTGKESPYDAIDWKTFQAKEIGEGIYIIDAYLEINYSFGDFVDNYEATYENNVSIEQIPPPESLGITEYEKAVSFRLTEKVSNTKSYILAIRKEQYGIVDLGYHAFLSEIEEGEESQLIDAFYVDETIRYMTGYVYDGGEYLYFLYPESEEGHERNIITITNP